MAAPRYLLEPARLTDVVVDDAFWTPRLEANRTQTLPAQYRQLEDTGRLDAWRRNWQPGQPNEPHIFWDSDVAKWIEAACHSLATHADRALRSRVEALVALIVANQQPDGYLNTHYSQVEPDNRWTNLRDCHELYCAGHLMEAAVAHHEATGERSLLDVLSRYADHIDRTFGREPGKRRGYCGHEEIELALVKLARATGDQRYLRLAAYFIDERGRQPHYFDLEAQERAAKGLPDVFRGVWAQGYAYGQAHQPLREQSEVVGHAVRAFYVYSGMVDVAALTGDAGLLTACRRLWQDTTRRKMYITGAVGPSAHNEGFTGAYDLPNETAYGETCANIALLFFAHRMLQATADSQYADVMERLLYNGVLSGVSLDGKRFFYSNPLASAGHVERQDWFGCACCPPNLARLLASLGRYVYSTRRGGLYVHLYVGGRMETCIDGTAVVLEQRTEYPWAGQIEVRLEPAEPAEFDLMLRLPGWCRRHRLRVNGRAAPAASAKGYLKLRRQWRTGDVVSLCLDMPVERIVAHPRVVADTGRVALQRGPVVFCLEQIDNRAPVRTLALVDSVRLTSRFDPRLLGGALVVEGTASVEDTRPWSGHLYRPAAKASQRQVPFRAVPYALWNNRGPGEMAVWLRRG